MIRKAKLILTKNKSGKATSFRIEKTSNKVESVSTSYTNSKKAIDSNYASYVTFNQEVLKKQFSH